MDQSKSLPQAKPSFFDSAEEIPCFWKQTNLSDFANYTTIFEGEFYTRNKKYFTEWEACRLSIRGTFLVYSKKKKESQTVNYIDLDMFMYQVKIISQEEKAYSKKYKHAFFISTHQKGAQFYCKDQAFFNNFISYLKKFCVMTNFTENYTVLNALGSGGYGQVYLIEDKLSKAKYAGKFIRLSSHRNKEKQKVMIQNEIKTLRKLNHPNIVKLYEVYEVQNEVCMVLEYIQGKRLFEHVVKSGKLSEAETALIFKQIFLILSYLENEGIIHRDIKPENILFTPESGGKITLKLIDFGLATYHYRRDIIKKCGTAGYTAPEVLLGDSYDFRADLYSAGIVLFVCLTGKPAFSGDEYKDLLEQNKLGIVKYREKYWNSISPEAKELVQKILVPNPSKRISLNNVLTHKWLIMQLPLDEMKEIAEYNFKVGKMEIAEENKISEVPVTTYQLSVYSRSQSFAITSQSFVTSKVGLGSNSKCMINSFYKIKSREDSEADTLNTLVSPGLRPAYISRNISLKSYRTANSIKKDFVEAFDSPKEDLMSFSNPKPFRISPENCQTPGLLEEHVEYLNSEELADTDNEGSPIIHRYRRLQGMNLCFGKFLNNNNTPSASNSVIAPNFSAKLRTQLW